MREENFIRQLRLLRLQTKSLPVPKIWSSFKFITQRFDTIYRYEGLFAWFSFHKEKDLSL